MKLLAAFSTACSILLLAISPSHGRQAASLALATPGDVGSRECRSVQLAAQAAVASGGPYRNHGQLVRTAAHVVDAAVTAGAITEECASCIVSQFARRIPIEDQTPCGEEAPRGLTSDLRGPEQTFCDGPVVGSTNITPRASGGLEFTLTFTSGPANVTFDVFWVCTLVANGCHNDACNFISLGHVTTDGTGHGSFMTVLAGGNPFPGNFVHIDLLGGPVFTSVFGAVPPSTAPALRPGSRSSTANVGSDPTLGAGKPVPIEPRTWSLIKETYR